MADDVTRYINPRVERELWARAAGRCQFNGCNKLLYKSPVTQECVNIAKKAHIYSFSEKGPRGWGTFVTNKQALNNIDNLILMCHDCHKTIDQDKAGTKYSAELLGKWKREHEQRIAWVTGIASDKKSHVVFYGSNIGEQKSPIQKMDAIDAMFPEHYPAEEPPILLSMSCTHEDRTPEFWDTESTHLKKAFERYITPRIEENNPAHFSLFAMAPMPLLRLK
ncbi:MAG: SAVED domain-containing protein [Bacillota bacterium]|nr:SAVED domain-containing protein [Bacillota bacterium]